MKSIALAFVASLAINPAHALQGWTSCHTAGTTVVSISGIGTRTAKMVSVVTVPDAIEACQQNEPELNAAALRACADKGDYSTGPVTAWANCEKGTITEEYAPGKVLRFKFPLVNPNCALQSIIATYLLLRGSRKSSFGL